MNTLTVKVGDSLSIGGESPIVVQTMCNTHTSDVEASVAQCLRLYEAGAQMIRLTVPSLAQVGSLREIKERLQSKGISTPLVADVHFSSEIAIAVAEVVEKVRIIQETSIRIMTRHASSLQDLWKSANSMELQ